jgi:Dullard-like phosphatase family protein
MIKNELLLNNPKNNIESTKNAHDTKNFYSSFDNFMKNRLNHHHLFSRNQNNNKEYNFSKLMNSLHEYNKKKHSIDLNDSKNENETKKKEKLFKGISLQNFNDSLSKKRNNIIIKKLNTSSSFIIPKRRNLEQKIEKKEIENISPFKTNYNSISDIEMKDYEKLEKIIIELLETIKKPDEFRLNCKYWIDTFETMCEKSNIIKINDEKEKRISLLIISIIAAFLKLKRFENNEDSKKETIIKDLSEIMILHHKIFLFLWYDKIVNKDNPFNSYNNNSFLFQQIKIYYPKIININKAKNEILEKEIKFCNTLFYFMLKSILNEIIKNDEMNEYKINEIFSFKEKQLIDLFRKIYNSKNEIISNSNINKINMQQTKKSIFNYRNKKIIKKHYLIDENILFKTSINNYSFKNIFNNSQDNKNLKNNINDTYNISYIVRNKFDNELTKKSENKSLEKKNHNLVNSFSCKVIPSPFLFEAKIHKNKKTKPNILTCNKSCNKSMYNIPIDNIPKLGITKSNTSKILLNKLNANKPKPPFLTKNILYSSFNKKNFTLILDLDETLIKYKIENDSSEKGKLIFRPGLLPFLNKVFPLFDLILWTSGQKDYADDIINKIEKDKKFFSVRLYREHATYKNKIYIKDLSNLGRPLDKIIIIDDKESSFSLQRDNGILIKPFHGSKLECQKDYVLMDLYNILTKIMFDRSKDVRIGINKYKKEILKKISYINNSDDIENYSNN